MAEKKQHYLQRAYLKNFASRVGGKQHYFWSFDKFTQAIAERDIYNFCHERYFYDFVDDDGKIVPVDANVIGPLEYQLLPAFQELCRNPTVEVLDKNKQQLARSAAFLILRSAAFRAVEKDLITILAAAELDLEIQGTSKNDYKKRHYEYFRKAFEPPWRRLYGMNCRLLRNPDWEHLSFWTSDKAYILPGVGADGYSSAGVLQENGELQWNSDATLLNRADAELLVPLRPDLMLSFHTDSVPAKLPKIVSMNMNYVCSVNEAQIRGCLRYVFSVQSDFQLANDYLLASPEYGGTNRLRVKLTLES